MHPQSLGARLTMFLIPGFCAALIGCATNRSNRNVADLRESRVIGGAAPEVLDRAERAVAALGFSPWRGNPGMVVGSDADPTLLTPGAMVIGFVLLPITIATSPIAVAIGEHDSAAWWPLAAFCLER